jgi:hypothetical protein
MPRLSKILLGSAAVLALMQLVRCEHDNPPVKGELQAPAEVKAILERACYDCHSNETIWPWYSQIAPVSWLIHHDVEEGREHLNFSEWSAQSADEQKHKLDEIEELAVETSDMPLPYYLPLHSGARVSDADKQTLRAWLDQARVAP